MKDNLLLIGGAGFIGGNIVEQASSEYNVRVLDSFSEQVHGSDFKKSYLYRKIVNKCEIIHGSVLDDKCLKEALKDIDYIIYLAAETGTGQSMYMVNKYNNVNIMGFSNLFQVLLDIKKTVKKIVLPSSRSVYGEGKYLCKKCGVFYPRNRNFADMLKGEFEVKCPKCGDQAQLLPTTEDSATYPASVYAVTKLAQEYLLQTMGEALDIPYTVLRYQNVYGAGQSLSNPYTGILSIFSVLMREDKPINIFEDGCESRDFINVKDVAQVTYKSLKNEKSNGKTINVGSGKNIPVIEVAELLKKAYNSNSKLEITGDFRKGDIRHNIADISLMKSLIGYEPSVSFDEGLLEFVNWVSGENTNDSYENSLNEMKNKGLLINAKK